METEKIVFCSNFTGYDPNVSVGLTAKGAGNVSCGEAPEMVTC